MSTSVPVECTSYDERLQGHTGVSAIDGDREFGCLYAFLYMPAFALNLLLISSS